MAIEAYGDGCVEPCNPGGYASYGVLIKKDGKVIHAEGQFVGRGPEMSNNVAEYSAVCSILHYLIDMKLFEATTIRMDSKLVIHQLNRNWKAKGGLYMPYYQKASHLLATLRELNPFGVRLLWIPRQLNEECDTLSKEVLKKKGVTFRLQPESVKG